MGILSFLTSRKGQPDSEAALKTNVRETNAPAKDFHAQPMDINSYLASDETEWLNYLREAVRTYRKPGVTLKEEYHIWLSIRARTRAATHVADAKAG